MALQKPLLPNTRVKLVGRNGNAFSILARVAQAMRQNGIDGAQVSLFQMWSASSRHRFGLYKWSLCRLMG
jgi:hypothetical protein